MDRKITPIAGRQLGLVTRRQLLEIGLSSRSIGHRLASGRMSTVHPGIYRIEGAPVSFEQHLLAALYAAGCGAISHKAAAVVFGLKGVNTDVPEITIPHRRRVKLAGVVTHRTRDLGAIDICRKGLLCLTTPARTLVDLAPILPLIALENATDDARLRKLTTLADLRAAIDRRAKPGVPTVTPLRALVHLKDGTLHRRWFPDGSQTDAEGRHRVG